ncbi:uncharacterized protein APUU_70825S [Aspergillus puulaauensis]|uniref:Uncharacterized protein n=1 Tax=Aspergillus puulaauensis TaxID=1220207 RepID=A0A7R7XWZ0_9EURO|nr:uncharacterized protein APUU_70825S [Aspergillus puulaauensis]BCS29255.1 hypothetical protein APUU_70825S [Aspergillus puulaauensis]
MLWWKLLYCFTSHQDNLREDWGLVPAEGKQGPSESRPTTTPYSPPDTWITSGGSSAQQISDMVLLDLPWLTPIKHQLDSAFNECRNQKMNVRSLSAGGVMPGLPSSLNIRYFRQRAQRIRFFLWTLRISLGVGIVTIAVGIVMGVARRIARFALHNVQHSGPDALGVGGCQ